MTQMCYNSGSDLTKKTPMQVAENGFTWASDRMRLPHAYSVIPAPHSVKTNEAFLVNTTVLNNPVKIDDLTQQFATSGVYVIYCTRTDTFYIGQANIIINRLLGHFENLEARKHQNDILQREYDMFGRGEFECDVLIDMPESSKLERLRQEQREISSFIINHRRLYNKNHGVVKVNEPMPPTTHSDRPIDNRDTASITTMTPREYTRAIEETITESVCEDCGTVGITYTHIFECDDKIMRCVPCVENRLNTWRITFNEIDQRAFDRRSEVSYFRWLLNDRQHINEQLANALTRFVEKHNQAPNVMYIKGIEVQDEFEGIKIRTRKITPKMCLDIPIMNNHHLD